MVKTVEEAKRRELYEVIKEVLGDDYIYLKFTKINIEECYESEGNSRIRGDLQETQDGVVTVASLDSYGCGVLDAVFNGILDHYLEDYPSLGNVSFVGFGVSPNFSTKKTSGADAEVEVTMQLSNSSNSIMTFRNTGKSFVRASVFGLAQAMEFYINSEKAFRQLRFLIEDASKRNRGDVKQGYVSKISKIVKVTSYENI